MVELVENILFHTASLPFRVGEEQRYAAGMIN